MLPDVVLDDGVSAVKAVLVPEALEDALGGVPLLLGDAVIIVQDVVDDAGEGLVLSLSKGWASGVESAAGSPAELSRPASCAPCPGAGRTPGRLPGRSSPPPSPPGEPVDIRPPGTSVAPSAGSANTLMDGGGRHSFQPPDVSNLSAHVSQYISAAYNYRYQSRSAMSCFTLTEPASKGASH